MDFNSFGGGNQYENFAEIDKNFKIESKIEKDDIVFFDVLEKPFKVYGLFYEDGKFRRIDPCLAKKIEAWH